MACQALDVIAAGVTVLSAVGRRRRMMVFSGVASQCEERGAMPAGTNFEIAATIVPSGTLVPPKRFSVRSVAHAATPPQSNSGHHHPEKFRVWISGQVRRVTKPIRREMRRRAAVEPVIGHAKAEHRMGRNYLKGRDGDRINAVLAAAGYNFGLLLRWLARLLRAL